MKSFALTVGDLGYEATVVSGETPAVDVEALFRADPLLRAVVIAGEGNQFLLTREQLDHRMTGRLGYGRALNTRTAAQALVSPVMLTLPSSMDLRSAATALLERPEDSRYHDVLVATPGAPRIVPVSEVFHKVSDLFRQTALHDPLTGLANRAGLEESAVTLMTGRRLSCTAALYIDLDDFKIINDTFGHRAGDGVLTDVAARIRTCTGPADTVARLGGDEFAVVLTDADKSLAHTVAHRILRCMDDPFFHDGHQLRLSATLGLAMLSDITAQDSTPEDAIPTTGGQDIETLVNQLLRHADTAMLQAKHEGKRRLGQIDPSQPANRFTRQALIRRRLPQALANAGFSLHYQPLLDIGTETCLAVEALLRWNDPELGKVSPDEFIHVAEHTGEIHAIGRWVIDEACRQARAWADAGTPRAISVNISPLQLAAGNLDTEIHAALQRHSVPAALLNTEITESAAITDLPSAGAQLRTLIKGGIEVALDDYGTAYSSLSLLRDLPLTGVKLDKSFIDIIDTDPTSAILVASVIAPAKALGLKTTAEGVEREEQLAILRELGCDTAQGYFISRPLHPADLDTTNRVTTNFDTTPTRPAVLSL